MFLILVLLTGLGQLYADLKSHKTFLQTTVPEKISSSGNNKESENNVAYVIPVGEKQYLVHLKKQSFISSGSVVSYDKKDIKHSKPLKTQMDCNYQGYVAGFPNSIVTLNICSGLRGLLQFKNISYGIEPMEAMSGFVHMIYEEKNDNVSLLGDSDIYSWSRDSHYEVRKTSQGTEFFKISPLYLEMHIVVDKDLFEYMGSDIKTVTQKIILIIGLVNTMLTQLKLTVVVSSIEIWSDKNKISTTGNPDHILFRLLEWEQKLLILRPHHTTFLFSFRNYTSLIGTTYPGKLCHLDYAKGVALYSKGLSLESFAVIIVQLLGLNVGLTYDNNIGSCHCPADVCTMTPKAVHFQGIKEFSICSLDEFKYIAAQSGLKCLLNRPIDVPVYKQARACGNGILDPGEQCDCGTTTTCTHKRCCDARTCLLKKGMDCGSGRCCTQNCKIKPANVLCRPSVDKECDFVEYCNGTSGSCMPDTFVRNGQYCDSGDAFCYQGKCRTFDRQCQALIGGDSTGGPFDCFEELNSRNDKFGNCGNDYCQYPHMLCGKLACSWPHKKLVLKTNLSVIYVHLRDELCVGTHKYSEKIFHESVPFADRRDETYVEDGSVCGPGMFCIRMSCQEVRFQMNFKLCNASHHCSKKGICNNFNHCHCEKGFSPPSCIEKENGFGSIDDGHSIMDGKSFIQGRRASARTQLQLIAYICLPVLIITTAVLIKQTKLRELREESESEGSVTEENSSSKLSVSASNSL